MKNNRWLIVVIAVVILITIYYLSIKNKSEKTVVNYLDYDGDDYSGTSSYLGDYDTMVSPRNRKDAYAKPTTLFKVTEPTNILSYNKDKGGSMSLIKTGRKFKKGSQVQIFNESLLYPIVKNDSSFVEMANGNFIKLSNISKV